MVERETQKTIEDLKKQDEPLDEPALIHLSNLTREEQGWLDEAWDAIPLDKRRRLVQQLSEDADEDFQLDFSATFRRGLQDVDAEVRRVSVDGLWEVESVSLIRPFLRLLSDESEAVRASAATALGRFVLHGELEYLPSERYGEIIEALIAMLEDDSLPVAVRRRALESLGYSGDERMRGFIARAYDEAAAEMRLSALLAMGRSADDYWSGQVRLELNNEDPAFRFEAARAAGELSNQRAVPRLIALTRDRDREVREMAIWALGQIGGGAAQEALQRIVQSAASPAVRDLARDSLAELSMIDEGIAASFLRPTLYGGESPDDMFADEDDDTDALDVDEW